MKTPQQLPSPAFSLLAPNWQLLKAHLTPIVFLYLLPVLTITLGQVLLIGNYPAEFEKQISDATNSRIITLQSVQEVYRSLSETQIQGLYILLAGIAWTALMRPAAVWYQAQAVAQKYPKLADAYRNGFKRLFPLILLYGIISGIILGGLALFILPGLIFGYLYLRYYYLAEYYLVAEGMSIRNSIRQAREDSGPYPYAVWGLLGTQFLFILVASSLGSLFFGESSVAGVISNTFLLLVWFLPALRFAEFRKLSRASSAAPVKP